MSLKTFANRCRCCLENFYNDEEINKITNFFKTQFFSFTRLELQESDLLSSHVCDFCHQELLRFSGFKKDLIEKQQRLNELLKQHNEKSAKIGKRKEQPQTFKDVDELNDGEIKSEIVEEEEEEEEELSESSIASDDDKDQDFIIVRANEHPKKLSTKRALASQKVKKEPDSLPSSTITCDYCGKDFKAKQGLSRHVQSHIEVSIPWKCSENDCEFAGSSKIKLNLHKLEIHEIETFPNPPAIQTEKKLKKEKIKLESKGDHTCFCKASFQTALSLRAHKNRLHGNLNKCSFGCENVQYIKTGHYIRHIQSRHPEKLDQVLKMHGLTTAASGSSTAGGALVLLYHCDQCNFKALKKSSLKSHLESHLPDFVRQKYECARCDKKFTRISSLRVHGETVHDKIRKFKCPKCPEVSFKQAGHLNDHIASKHGKNRKKSFRCNLCSKMFLKRYMMNRHQQLAHKVNGRLLPLMPTLPRAIAPKRMKGDRKFKCFCGKEFPYQSRLVKHQLKHDEGDTSKKFPCQAPECGHSFTARCNLIRHQKQKGHLPANELKRLKFGCICGERFFSCRGYAFHKTKCELTKSKKKKITKIRTV